MPTKNKILRLEMRISPAFNEVIEKMQLDANWRPYNRTQIIERLIAAQGEKMGLKDIYSRITHGEDWELKFNKIKRRRKKNLFD
jgi:hypothetical protein